jgi:hypothetical protein
MLAASEVGKDPFVLQLNNPSKLASLTQALCGPLRRSVASAPPFEGFVTPPHEPFSPQIFDKKRAAPFLFYKFL